MSVPAEVADGTADDITREQWRQLLEAAPDGATAGALVDVVADRLGIDTGSAGRAIYSELDDPDGELVERDDGTLYPPVVLADESERGDSTDDSTAGAGDETRDGEALQFDELREYEKEAIRNPDGWQDTRDAPIRDQLAQHFERARPAFEALGTTDGTDETYETGVLPGHGGWYERWEADEPFTDDSGTTWTHKQSPRCMGDADQLDAALEAAVEWNHRDIYALTTYKREGAHNRETWFNPKNPDSGPPFGKDEQRDSGTVPKDQLATFSVWTDLDLADDETPTADENLKLARSERGLTPDEREAAETGLTRFADAYAQILGIDRADVPALDSGGGAYMLTPPAVTAPIGEYVRDVVVPELADEHGDEFDPADADRVCGEVLNDGIDRGIDRLQNEWESIVDEHPETAAVLDPDIEAVNNLNRQYKCVLSIHKKYDHVVIPVDTSGDSVVFNSSTTSVFDVGDEHYSAGVEWAESFTSRKFADGEYVQTFVENLWPDYVDAADSDDWRDVIRAYVADTYTHELDDSSDDSGASVFTTSTAAANYEPPEEAPDDVPHCLAKALEARAEHHERDDIANVHNQVNRPLGILVAAHGYDTKAPDGEGIYGTIEQYTSPVDTYDYSLTKAGIDGAVADDGTLTLNPPSARKLYDYGILEAPYCPCDLHTDNVADYDPETRWMEPCDPPAAADGSEPIDIDTRRADMEGPLYSEFVDSEDITVWAQNAGEGKTTSAARGAAAADRRHAVLLPKHENAREFQLDDAKPGGYMHPKGSEQPLEDVCMDAKIAGDEHDCPKHGDDDCPTMCPVWNQDDETIERFKLVASELGVQEAHSRLRLGNEPWHGESCEWQDQFETAENAERLVTVHEYATLKSITDGRDVIVDDLAGTFIDDSAITANAARRIAEEITQLVADATVIGSDDTDDGQDSDDDTDALEELHTQTTLVDTDDTDDTDDVRRIGELDETAVNGLLQLAAFARELADVLPSKAASDLSLADLELPEFGTHPEYYDDKDDIPAADRDDAEPTKRRSYVGDPGAGYYTMKSTYVVDRPAVAEPIAKANVAYADIMLERVYDGDWSGEPILLNRLIAALASVFDAHGEAEHSRECRRALSVSPTLRECPRCGARTEFSHGRRVCDHCSWDQLTDRFVWNPSPERTRAAVPDADGSADELVIRRLPAIDDLPAPENVLVLDATPVPETIAAVWGVDPDDVSVVADDEYALPYVDVIQAPDGAYHKGTLLDDRRGAINRLTAAIDTILEKHRENGDDVLVVSDLKVRDHLELPDGVDHMHYYALRGLDRPDHDAIILVGAPHPNPQALKAEADLLCQDLEWANPGGIELSNRDAPDVADPVERKLNYVDGDGNGRLVKTKSFTGFAGKLFDSMYGAEIEQAAHRIRPILADRDDRKAIYMLTNVPTNVPVDELVDLDTLAGKTGIVDTADLGDTAVELLAAMLEADRDAFLPRDIVELSPVTERPTRKYRKQLTDAGLVTQGEYQGKDGREYRLTALAHLVSDQLE